jgi:hypothetical protein
VAVDNPTDPLNLTIFNSAGVQPTELAAGEIPSSSYSKRLRIADRPRSSVPAVADEENDVNTAIVVWQDKVQADAFDTEAQVWMQTLEELGHTLQTDNRGETMIQLEPQK